MKTHQSSLLLGAVALIAALGSGAQCRAGSTINATGKYAYGGNIGWINWRPDQPAAPEGAVVGEFVCAGSLYAANVGWISLGDSTPLNGVQYQNNSSSDYGVNVTGHAVVGGTCEAQLRGFAYGANIGWINFEGTGNPRVDLQTGAFKGYAWSANCGWINLGENGLTPLKTDTVLAGTDSDGDGLADGYELTHQPNLGVMNESTDTDGDGLLDIEEAAADTDPNNHADGFWIISVTGDGINSPSIVTFSSRPTRKYVLEQTGSLAAPFVDSGLGLFAPDAGNTTTRTAPAAASPRQFYKVGVRKPLSP